HHPIRLLEVQHFPVLQERGDVLVGVVADADASRSRVCDDAVVDISEIHDLRDAKAPRPQKSPQDIVENECPEIADVREIVDCRSAGVDADLAWAQGHEGFLAAGQRVLEDNFAHGFSRAASPVVSGRGILAEATRTGKPRAFRLFRAGSAKLPALESRHYD